jgi:CRP-like cAMP-binding protein
MTDADIAELLPPPWRDLASDRARARRYAAGAAVFRQGDRARGAFYVAVGRVALVRTLADGARVTLFAAAAGDTFAEASLFGDAYHCDALVLEDAVVVDIPKADLHSRLADDPAGAAALARTLAAQVRDLRARLELRNIKSARERVLAWLRLNAAGDPPVVVAQPTWLAVASEIGLTHEALYRALARLADDGAIARDGRTVRLEPHGAL